MTIKLTGYNLLQFPDRNWLLDKLNIAEDVLVVISDSLNPNELKCNTFPLSIHDFSHISK
jgi:hypothetical protein